MNHLIYLFTVLLVVTSCNTPAPTTRQGEEDETDQPQAAATPAASPHLNTQQIASYVAESGAVTMPDQLSPPFDSLLFDRVVAYDFNKRLRPFSSVLDLSSQRYAPDIEKQQALDAQQVEQLLALLGSKDAFGGIKASCFDPRMAFVFYQGTQAQLVVDICLDCNFLRSSVQLPAMVDLNPDPSSVETFRLRGFSSLGREQIIKLAAALQLYYGELGPEDYDFSIGG